jgi:hypothetical protein
MDFYKNLPLAARIAIPGVLVLLVAMIAYATTFKPPSPVTVLSTQDIGVFNTARTVLERNDVEFEESRRKNTFTLEVTPNHETTAAQALANSGVKDTTSMVKKIDCPAPPGFTGTKAANTRANNCEAAKAVQAMLLSAGATAANVQVSQEENGTLLGPETSMNVVAQVFLPANMQDTWNAEQAARAISRSVGTSLDRVSITDEQLQSMFDGTSSGKGGVATGSSAITSSLGCGDIAAATEIETKRAAVRNCYEGSIGDKLTELLGGSDRYVLTVEPTIDSVSRTRTTLRRTKGPISDRSSQKGSGQSVLDESSPPNSVEETSINPAGDLSSLRINVTLDKAVVTEDQRLAVTSLLATYVSTQRGDPAPTVKMSQFDNGGGTKPDNSELEAIRTQAQDAAKGGAGAGGAPEFRTTTKTPTWMIAIMVALVVGIVAAIAILWRRSSAMAAERKRIEVAFSNEQKLFENFAQQNPDDLATDLNALFGAPSAPERTY